MRLMQFVRAALAATALIGGLNLKTLRADEQPFRPPAVPIVTFDPYLSIWSEGDPLTDDVTRHWTHHEHPLASLIRVDGKTYRLMGAEPRDVPPLPQTSLRVFPTRSIYEFENPQVRVTLTFMTAALPADLDVYARPLSYINWDVKAVDGTPHQVTLYDSASSLLAVNVPTQKVDGSRESMGDLTALRVGTTDQPVLEKGGDDIRIDWGYVYLATPTTGVSGAIGGNAALLDAFVKEGKLPADDDKRMPRAAKEDEPVMAFAIELGKVGAEPVSRHVMVALDEIYAITFFGKPLRPYWRRNGATPSDLLQAADRDYAALARRCAEFDDELMTDLTKVGGARYAQIAALAYRQCWAATGLAADANKQPLLFTKENTSNGDIATVDVIFPMEPQLLFFSPTLTKASLAAVLNYAASSHWKFPNAPHDLGTYPIARGTDDGGEGMPVEESGNLLILCDALAREEGNAEFSATWWPQLTQWAKYLEQYGLDPEEQLCTDDFMGHLAHNANLSVKAILGLACYGDLCRMRGETAEADRYAGLARIDAQHWVKVAADGDHYRLAFDKPNTWSQKYNLVWDKILGLDVFPPSVAQKEVAHYKKVIQKYGVPLDSRTHLTKTDWSLWSATLADDRSDFETLVSPIYDYLTTTTARSPLVDSYMTDDIHSDGMHARSVVGGIFIKMLSAAPAWKKWSSRDKAKVGGWAPLPTPPKVSVIVPSSQFVPQTWSYTIQKPAENWMNSDFDASSWKTGPGGFGTTGTPGAVVRTVWKTDDIWLRREFQMPAGDFPNLAFSCHHDEDIEIYINGVLAGQESGFISNYAVMPMRATGRAALKPGKNLIAVHCHQTEGGQYVDVGLVETKEQ